MKKLYQHVQPYKFRLTVFALLCGATLLSLALFRVRTILSGHFGLCLFGLEYFPRLDSAWAGAYGHHLFMEAQIYFDQPAHVRLCFGCSSFPMRLIF